MNSVDLKLLVCYVLASLKQPMPGDDLCRTLSEDGFGGYFELFDLLGELSREGAVCLTEEGYALSPRGDLSPAAFGRRLPAATRERAVESCLRLTAARRRKEEAPCEIAALDNGEYAVTLSIKDGTDDLMRVTLRVGDREQADRLVERFQNDPMLAYTGIIALLTGDLNAVGGQLLSNPL